MRRSTSVGPLSRRFARTGFSLVELVVVLGIIGVLMGLLLPALQSARMRARSTQCQSNLRQLGLALHVYGDAYRETLMPVSFYNWADPDSPQRYWFGEVLDPPSVPAVDRRIDRQKGFLIPYIEGARPVQDCPDFTRGRYKLRFDGATAGYGYNYNYLGPGPVVDFNTFEATLVLYKWGQVRSTSQTVAFADSAQINWFSNGATFDNPQLEESYYLEPPSSGYPTVHFRHQGMANVLFLDAHVESRLPTENLLPSFWPPAALKRLEKEKLADLGTTDELFDRE